MFAWIRRNLDIYRSDFGRRYGWFVERRGERVAELVDPVWDSAGQFWHVYTIVPLATDPEVMAVLRTQDFWHQRQLVYINPRYGTRVCDALAGGVGPHEGRWRVSMRFLYVPLRFPLLWEFVGYFLPPSLTPNHTQSSA